MLSLSLDTVCQKCEKETEVRSESFTERDPPQTARLWGQQEPKTREGLALLIHIETPGLVPWEKGSCPRALPLFYLLTSILWQEGVRIVWKSQFSRNHEKRAKMVGSPKMHLVPCVGPNHMKWPFL